MPGDGDARHVSTRSRERNLPSTISRRGETQHTYGGAFHGFRLPSQLPSEAAAARPRRDYPSAIDSGAHGPALRRSRQARNRRHMAIPRPTGFFRMAVYAGMIKYIHHGRRNVRAQQQWRAGSIRCFMRERVHKYRRKEPHQKQTGSGKSHTPANLQADRPRRATVCDCLAHVLLDLPGRKSIPGFNARAGLAPTPGAQRYSGRIPPSTSSPRRSSGGSGSLARPLL